ncbi:hypothetical protein MXB_2128 [Myxobolus squamalis]|nr:hypothetical protein MXB_2128 [Myxobolus squamalis]
MINSNYMKKKLAVILGLPKAK